MWFHQDSVVFEWCDQDDGATRFDAERHSHHRTIRHPATRVVTSNAIIASPPRAARSLLLLSLTNVVASPSLLHRLASRRPLTLSRIASPRAARSLSLTHVASYCPLSSLAGI